LRSAGFAPRLAVLPRAGFDGARRDGLGGPDGPDLVLGPPRIAAGPVGPEVAGRPGREPEGRVAEGFLALGRLPEPAFRVVVVDSNLEPVLGPDVATNLAPGLAALGLAPGLVLGLALGLVPTLAPGLVPVFGPDRVAAGAAPPRVRRTILGRGGRAGWLRLAEPRLAPSPRDDVALAVFVVLIGFGVSPARSRRTCSNSARFSSGRSTLASPGFKRPRRSGPMRTRAKRRTGCPRKRRLRRICRFFPSMRVSERLVVPESESYRTSSTWAGDIRPSSRFTPRWSRVTTRASTFPFTFTRYSRSFPRDGCRSVCERSPSFVIRSKPDVSRSKRPTGKTRPTDDGIKSMTVRRPSLSLTVVTTPLGLFTIQ
jgi:hypothetical protein